MGIGFGIVLLSPNPYRSRDIALFMSKNRSRKLFPGHVTTGSRIRYVHYIERGRFSGYRFWNHVPSPCRSRDIDVLDFKGEFALEGRFLGGKWGRNVFFKNLTPQRHFLTRKHAVWYISRENRINGVTQYKN